MVVSVPVGAPVARLPPVSSAGSGSLPARVTGPGRQNQNHTAPPVVARAPHVSVHGANSRPCRTPAAPGTAVLSATDRVRKSIDRNHDRLSMEQRSHEQADALSAPTLEQVLEDPLERLTADLTALSLQHAAALSTPAPTPAPSTSTPSRTPATHPSSSSRPPAPSRSTSSSTAPAQSAPAPSSAHVPPSAQSSFRRHGDVGESGLPPQLLALRDPASPVALPPPTALPPSCLPLDNWKLDKLVLSLSANAATWRRALLLFEWLKAAGHQLDDRLCTTLIRVCSDHGDAVSALAVYDWMVSPQEQGGAALEATPYTYTAAMRAALAGGLTERALGIWNEAWRRHTAGRLALDCRLCITYLELCTRLGLTDQALAMYGTMRAAPAGSRMSPTVHAYTAAMRAATEGGRWFRALDIWADLRASGCEPTGHAYSAAISACAAAGDWRRAVSLFDEMTGPGGIRPDVVSCTALITALAAGGEADRAEAVVAWMLANGVRPNARTYTALLSALGNARRWARAVEVLGRMQSPEWGGVQPNAYTYSALLKSLGEHGQWQLAEAVFSSIERQVLGGSTPIPTAASSSTNPQSSSSSGPFAPPPPPPPPHPSPAAFDAPTAAAAAVASSLLQQLQAQQQLATLAAPAFSGLASVPSSLPTPAPSSAAPAAPIRSWTSPSELNGLSLDLHSTNASASPARPFDPLQIGAPASASSLIFGAPAPDALSSSDPIVHPSALANPHAAAAHSRRSFSLFSHPAPSSAAASTHSPASTSDGSTTSSSSLADPYAAWASAPSPADFTAAGLASLLPSASEAPSMGIVDDTATAAAASALLSSFYAPSSSSAPAPSDPQPSRHSPAHPHAHAHHHSNGPNGHPNGSSSSPHHVVNEVVCGALMLAYERAGKWAEAVAVLVRAAHLGITPNNVMYNTAISAAGKAGQLEVAEKLYGKVRHPDAVTHETMIAAYGMAGLADRAEAVFAAMSASGLRPRDYAFCGLIAAHSLAGDWQGALRVRDRMRRAGAQPSVHVYNALLAACERAGQPDRALEVVGHMRREGVEGNALTAQLLALVGQQGVRTVEGQQVAAAALSAAVAAYGTLLMQTGLF